MGEGSNSQESKGPSGGHGKQWAAVLANPKLKLMDRPRKLSGSGPGGDAVEPPPLRFRRRSEALADGLASQGV